MLNQYRTAARLLWTDVDLPAGSRHRHQNARTLVTKVSDARKSQSVLSGVSAAALLHSRFFDRTIQWIEVDGSPPIAAIRAYASTPEAIPAFNRRHQSFFGKWM